MNRLFNSVGRRSRGAGFGSEARPTSISWFRYASILAAGIAVLAAPESLSQETRRSASVEAVARVLPCVVNIATETLVTVRDPFDSLLRSFWGPYYRRRPPQAQYSLGSGVIIDEAGYVLTNDHVVRRASRIWVRLAQEGGGKEYEAELIGGSGRGDVALLRVKAEAGERFAAAEFAKDDDLLLGETVLALGNPFGLGGSVSRGILSSKSRRPPTEGAPMDIADWLQTDAAINPGNSGGPLLNLKGEVIGLNVAVFREAQGIGFAIPAKRVKRALAEIFSPEMNRLWFGARIRPAGSALFVDAVEPGSPAERAGLREGDRVLRIDEKTPRGYIDFMIELNSAGATEDVDLTVEREERSRSVRLRLQAESEVFNAALIQAKLGLSVQELTPELAERLGLVTDEGLLIAAVDPDSSAREAGIERGHIILAVDGQPPNGLVAAAKILYGKKSGEKVVLEILEHRRQGRFVLPRRARAEMEVR